VYENGRFLIAALLKIQVTLSSKLSGTLLRSKLPGVWTGHFRRVRTSAETPAVLGLLACSVMVSFTPSQGSDELNLLSRWSDWKPCVQAWRGTAIEPTCLLSPRELLSACGGSWRYIGKLSWIQRYKHYSQLGTGSNNSTEVTEGSLYCHWCKWKPKHLPFNLKHCTAASCNFLTLHFADTV